MRWLVCLALLLAGCAPAARPHEGPGGATIVSLNPCTDAMLTEIAEPAQVLALSHYSHDPGGTSMDLATARRFRATGGTVEEVLALDPDMVVAGGFLPPATRNAFQRLGIRVETFGIAGSVAESVAQVRRMGGLTGQRNRAERLAADIEQTVQRAERGASRERPTTILWQPGGLVAGENTLIAELLRRTGFSSLSAARGMEQADYLSLERVLADPPEVLLVAGQERMQQHSALAELGKMRRVKFDSALLYCGGPVVIRAVERLVAVREGAA